MKFNKVLTLLPAFIFIVVCACSQEVHYNYARGTNFAAYHTYQWIDVPSEAKVTIEDSGPLRSLTEVASQDQLIAHDIHRAVDEQLAQKGLRRVEKNGELQISYHAVVREEKGVNLSGSGWSPDRGWGVPGGWWDASVQGHTSTIPVGAIVIDLYDSAAKQLVWRGDVSKTIDLNKDPNKNYKNLQKAMTKLFKNYPPQDK
jgi:hypothetical protein